MREKEREKSAACLDVAINIDVSVSQLVLLVASINSPAVWPLLVVVRRVALTRSQ